MVLVLMLSFLRRDQLSKAVAYICGSNGRRKTRHFCGHLSCITWRCWSKWRIWLTVLMIVVYLLLVLIWLTLITYAFIVYDPFSGFKTWYVGSFFILGVAAMTFITLRQHWVHYTSPDIQRYITRIAFFVLAYGFYSWLSLLVPQGSVYFNAIKDVHESYAIYYLFMYLMNNLKIAYPKFDNLLSQQPLRRLCCFFCGKCLIPKYFVKMCKIGVQQFCVVRVILAVVTVITQIIGVFNTGAYLLKNASLYIQVLGVVSKIVAIIFLVMFYRGTNELLRPIKPFFKLALIQAVVIITSFQQILLTILGLFVIGKSDLWDEFGFSKKGYTTPSTGIQNFLITIEMFVASLALFFVYSFKPYIHCPSDGDVPCVTACIQAFKEQDNEKYSMTVASDDHHDLINTDDDTTTNTDYVLEN